MRDSYEVECLFPKAGSNVSQPTLTYFIRLIQWINEETSTWQRTMLMHFVQAPAHSVQQ